MYFQTQQRPTIKQNLLRKIGQIKIENYHLGIVERDGKFGYFLKPGWHPSLNRWHERLIAIFPIKTRTISPVLKIQSSDGYTFRVRISVEFTFDPSRAIKNKRIEAVSLALNRDLDNALRQMVLRSVDYSLLKYAGGYSGEQLLSGNIRGLLTRNIRQHLQTVHSDMGLLIRPPQGVIIENISPPASFCANHHKNYIRQQAIEQLQNNPDTAFQVLLLEILEKQPNYVSLNGANSNMLLQIINEVFSSNGNHKKREGGAQPIIIDHNSRY
ncbi:SPFH domain-containing protein [candidate division KSB1 bacterium]|nr:SPFH domain-containing protein [candidate division KSB1 bacterium]